MVACQNHHLFLAPLPSLGPHQISTPWALEPSHVVWRPRKDTCVLLLSLPPSESLQSSVAVCQRPPPPLGFFSLLGDSPNFKLLPIRYSLSCPHGMKSQVGYPYSHSQSPSILVSSKTSRLFDRDDQLSLAIQPPFQTCRFSAWPTKWTLQAPYVSGIPSPQNSPDPCQLPWLKSRSCTIWPGDPDPIYMMTRGNF